jgi:hypothetical protein
VVRIYDPDREVWVDLKTLEGTATTYTVASTNWQPCIDTKYGNTVKLGILASNSYGNTGSQGVLIYYSDKNTWY